MKATGSCVKGAGHAALRVGPAFKGLVAGMLKQETDAAIAETRGLQDSLRLPKISLGDAQVVQGIRISHSVELLLDTSRMSQLFYIAVVRLPCFQRQ
jgi:hypothetical protein